MFSKIKNFIGRREISTKTMSPDEYLKAIEGPLMDCWIDNEMMNKLGIKNLFADNNIDVSAISEDDIIYCANAANMMAERIAHVGEVFQERSSSLRAKKYKDKMENFKNGVASSKDSDYHEFYTADNLLNIFKEANETITAPSVELDSDINVVKEELIKQVNALPLFKNAVFASLALYIGSSTYIMTGYSK